MNSVLIKPILIDPSFKIVVQCYYHDLEYKLKNAEENGKAKHDKAEPPEIGV